MKKMSEKDTEKFNIQQGPIYYASHLRAFLGNDQYVTVVCDEKNKLINVVVSGCVNKALALERILIHDDELAEEAKNRYGLDGYKLVVNGKRSSFKESISIRDISVALAGNNHFKGIERHDIPIPGSKKKLPMTFGIFKPDVVQAPCDNIGNPYGMENFLAEDFVKYAFNKKTRKLVAWTTDRK